MPPNSTNDRAAGSVAPDENVRSNPPRDDTSTASGDDRPTSPKEKLALARSLEDAEILASYIVRNNVPDVQDAVFGIAEAREAFDNDKLQGEAQKKFYVDFARLAAKLAPVTVSTLKSCLDEYGPGRRRWLVFGPCVPCSYARKAASLHRAWATAALILLLIVQSYWLVGSNLLAAVPKLTAADRAALLQDRVDSIAVYRPPLVAELTPSPTPTQAENTRRIALAEARQRQTERQEISKMLVTWVRVLDWMVPVSWLPESEEELRAKQEKGDFYYNSETHTDRVVLLASRVLEVLQQYLLPLLYGWLGAMAYVLRTLGAQARARLYSIDEHINFSLRIWLGIVAGLAIGWFFRGGTDDETATAVGSISALALAFVSGYSVDLLFTAMDRIVAAFSSAPDRPGGGAPAPVATS